MVDKKNELLDVMDDRDLDAVYVSETRRHGNDTINLVVTGHFLEEKKRGI